MCTKIIVYYRLSFNSDSFGDCTSFKDGTCFSSFGRASEVLGIVKDEILNKLSECYSECVNVRFHHDDFRESYQLTFKRDDFYRIETVCVYKTYLFLND